MTKTKQTLLEKAKRSRMKKGGPISQEQIDLALAWASDDITIKQVGTALGKNSTSIYLALARSLKRHIQNQKTGGKP